MMMINVDDDDDDHLLLVLVQIAASLLARGVCGRFLGWRRSGCHGESGRGSKRDWEKLG